MNPIIMASFFPEAGNVSGSNADMCSHVAGLSSSGSGDLFDLSYKSRSHTSSTSTTGRHLGFERYCRDYHTVFRGVLRHYA